MSLRLVSIAIAVALCFVGCSESDGAAIDTRIVTYLPAEDAGSNDSTLGAGRLVVDGGCLAFETADGDRLTLIAADDIGRFVSENTIEWNNPAGPTNFTIGQSVSLTGSERTGQTDSLEFVTEPLESCPSAQFVAGAITAQR